MSNRPLYNSRVIKIFAEYLKDHYPRLDVGIILDYAEMTTYEMNDPAHWFSQRQVDRFTEKAFSMTGNRDIAKEAGRYLASYSGLGPAKQYALGLMSPAYIYLLMEKVYPVFSRGANIRVKKTGRNKLEIITTPKADVAEKPYQCQNRIGMFEALARLYTEKFAKIEHPQCLHDGHESCRYLISWERTAAVFWKRVRDCSFAASVLAGLVLFFLLPFKGWILLIPLLVLPSIFLSFTSERVSNKELARTIEAQGDAAKDHLVEMDMRYHDALLVQEIGQASSRILNEHKLVKTVVNAMERHLDFQRGAIFLANRKKTVLRYLAGYGFDNEQKRYLCRTAFHLDKPDSKGFFVLSFRDQRPFLLNDIAEVETNLSTRSMQMAKKMDLRSLICVPIIYEKESLGVLAVDKVKPNRPLKQGDVSLLMGVAAQLAVSIINARSFQRLQESERKYRELVENANSIILRMSVEGNITFINEFAQRLFGYTEDEILGESIIGTIVPFTKSVKREFKGLVESLQRDPERQVVRENRNIVRNGKEVWVAWTYKPIFDGNGEFREILCIGNDVTELKSAEQQKKELEARLQRAQKMEAIGTLAGGVAHDLNNILTGLVSYPDLLLMEMPPESPLREPVLTIQKSGERAASIVQDLLTLARRGVPTMEVANLNQIVSDYLRSPVYERLELHHPDVRVETRLESTVLNILGSPTHLSQTLMNLVSNAAEAMPDGGTITISTDSRYVDKPVGGYEDVREGEYTTLAVSDHGVGLSCEDRERIFEPFYTRKAMGRSGTGLGMAVVWGTVKDHNGYIDVHSVVGTGSTFTLYFPVTRREISVEDAQLSIEDYRGNGETILVVDDVEEQREIATHMLTKLGYSVQAVSSGEAAFEYMRRNSADLLILDMIMDPGIDGLETYRRILEIHPKQKAIITSGFSETERVKMAQELGAGQYIKKPYLLEKIGLTVRSELERTP